MYLEGRLDFLLDPPYRGLDINAKTRCNVETLLVQGHANDTNKVGIELVRSQRFALKVSIASYVDP